MTGFTVILLLSTLGKAFLFSFSHLGIPIQEPEQSELTEQGESGTTWEVWGGWKGRTSSSEELGTLSLTLTAGSSLAGSYSGINLQGKKMF